MKKRCQRFIASVLSLVLFCTQALFAGVPEKSIWEQRRKSIESRSQPSSNPLLAQLTTGVPLIHRSVQSGLRAVPFPTPSIIKNLKPTAPAVSPRLASVVTSLSADGVIRDIRSSVNDESPIIVYIQDVHGHQEAQKNIASMILGILDTNPTAIVGLEGSAGDFPMKGHRTSSMELNREIGDFFFNVGLITGAEHAGFAAQMTPNFYGVEDPDLYRENVAAIKKAIPLQKRYLTQIEDQNKQLKLRKPKVYSAEMLSLDQKWRGFQDGMVGIGDYLTHLTSNQSGPMSRYPTIGLFLKTWSLEKSLDFNKAERERNRFLTKLVGKLSKNHLDRLIQQSVALRSGAITYPDYHRLMKETACKAGLSLSETPEFERYVSYVLQADALQPEALLSEISDYESLVWNGLCKNAEQRRLYEESVRLGLTEKLVRLTLTPLEWEKYKSVQRNLCRGGRRPPSPATVGKSDGEGRPPDAPTSENTHHAQRTTNVVSPFECFYETAEARNATLASNLKKKLSNSRSQVAVLVAGGFHSDGLKQLLAKGDVTFVTVSPKLTNVSNSRDNEYLTVFTRERTPLEKLFESPKISIVRTNATHPIPGLGVKPLDVSKGHRAVKLRRAVASGELTPEQIAKEVAEIADGDETRIFELKKALGWLVVERQNGRTTDRRTDEHPSEKPGDVVQRLGRVRGAVGRTPIRAAMLENPEAHDLFKKVVESLDGHAAIRSLAPVRYKDSDVAYEVATTDFDGESIAPLATRIGPFVFITPFHMAEDEPDVVQEKIREYKKRLDQLYLENAGNIIFTSPSFYHAIAVVRGIPISPYLAACVAAMLGEKERFAGTVHEDFGSGDSALLATIASRLGSKESISIELDPLAVRRSRMVLLENGMDSSRHIVLESSFETVWQTTDPNVLRMLEEVNTVTINVGPFYGSANAQAVQSAAGLEQASLLINGGFLPDDPEHLSEARKAGEILRGIGFSEPSSAVAETTEPNGHVINFAASVYTTHPSPTRNGFPDSDSAALTEQGGFIQGGVRLLDGGMAVLLAVAALPFVYQDAMAAVAIGTVALGFFFFLWKAKVIEFIGHYVYPDRADKRNLRTFLWLVNYNLVRDDLKTNLKESVIFYVATLVPALLLEFLVETPVPFISVFVISQVIRFALHMRGTEIYGNGRANGRDVTLSFLFHSGFTMLGAVIFAVGWALVPNQFVLLQIGAKIVGLVIAGSPLIVRLYLWANQYFRSDDLIKRQYDIAIKKFRVARERLEEALEQKALLALDEVKTILKEFDRQLAGLESNPLRYGQRFIHSEAKTMSLVVGENLAKLADKNPHRANEVVALFFDKSTHYFTFRLKADVVSQTSKEFRYWHEQESKKARAPRDGGSKFNAVGGPLVIALLGAHFFWSAAFSGVPFSLTYLALVLSDVLNILSVLSIELIASMAVTVGTLTNLPSLIAGATGIGLMFTFIAMMSQGQSQSMSQTTEQRQDMRIRLDQVHVQRQEQELYTIHRLLEMKLPVLQDAAIAKGDLRHFNQFDLDFTYLAIQKSDYEGVVDDSVWDYLNNDAGGGLSFYSETAGFILLVSKDRFPEDFIPIIAAHEYGHVVLDDPYHHGPVALEIAVAQRLRRVKAYVQFLVQKHPARLANFDRIFAIHDQLHLDQDRKKADETRKVVGETDSGKAARNLIRDLKWPATLINAVEKIQKLHKKADELIDDVLGVVRKAVLRGSWGRDWHEYMTSLENEGIAAIRKLRKGLRVGDLNPAFINNLWRQTIAALDQVVVREWIDLKARRGDDEAKKSAKGKGTRLTSNPIFHGDLTDLLSEPMKDGAVSVNEAFGDDNFGGTDLNAAVAAGVSGKVELPGLTDRITELVFRNLPGLLRPTLVRANGAARNAANALIARLGQKDADAALLDLFRAVELVYVPTPTGFFTNGDKYAAAHFGFGGEATGHSKRYIYVAVKAETGMPLFNERELAVIVAHELVHLLFKVQGIEQEGVHELATTVHRDLSKVLFYDRTDPAFAVDQKFAFEREAARLAPTSDAAVASANSSPGTEVPNLSNDIQGLIRPSEELVFSAEGGLFGGYRVLQERIRQNVSSLTTTDLHRLVLHMFFNGNQRLDPMPVLQQRKDDLSEETLVLLASCLYGDGLLSSLQNIFSLRVEPSSIVDLILTQERRISTSGVISIGLMLMSPRPLNVLERKFALLDLFVELSTRKLSDFSRPELIRIRQMVETYLARMKQPLVVEDEWRTVTDIREEGRMSHDGTLEPKANDLVARISQIIDGAELEEKKPTSHPTRPNVMEFSPEELATRVTFDARLPSNEQERIIQQVLQSIPGNDGRWDQERLTHLLLLALSKGVVANGGQALIVQFIDANKSFLTPHGVALLIKTLENSSYFQYPITVESQHRILEILISRSDSEPRPTAPTEEDVRRETASNVHAEMDEAREYLMSLYGRRFVKGCLIQTITFPDGFDGSPKSVVKQQLHFTDDSRMDDSIRERFGVVKKSMLSWTPTPVTLSTVIGNRGLLSYLFYGTGAKWAYEHSTARTAVMLGFKVGSVIVTRTEGKVEYNGDSAWVAASGPVVSILMGLAWLAVAYFAMTNVHVTLAAAPAVFALSFLMIGLGNLLVVWNPESRGHRILVGPRSVDVTKRADETATARTKTQINNILSVPFQKNVLQEAQWTGTNGILNHRIGAQVETIQADRETIPAAETRRLRPLVGNLAFLAGLRGLTYFDAKTLTVDLLGQVGAGDFSQWMALEWFRGRFVRFVQPVFVVLVPLRMLIQWVRYLGSKNVVILHADSFLRKDPNDRSAFDQTAGYLANNLATAVRRKQQYVLVARYFANESEDKMKEQLLESLREWARNEKIGDMDTFIAQNVVVVMRPMTLIKPSEVLAAAQADKAAWRAGTNVRPTIYSATPEDFDLRDVLARFLFALSGRKLIPVVDQVENARVYSLNA